MKTLKRTKSKIFMTGTMIVFGLMGVITTNALNEAPTTNAATSQPTVKTLEVINISGKGAFLEGEVNPNGLQTTYWFKYRQDGCVYYNTGFIYAGKGNENLNIEIPVTDLLSEKTYHYYVIAKNEKGIATSTELTFKTI